MQILHHKKNELFEVEFYQDVECTIPFDFKDAKDLYIELRDGDCSPILTLHTLGSFNIFTPYIPLCLSNECKHGLVNTYVKTIDDITPNLSKYIPKDNAVLFLNKKDYNYNKSTKIFQDHCIFLFKDLKNKNYIRSDYCGNCDVVDGIQTDYRCGCNESYCGFMEYKIVTIFLQCGTQTELQKASEVAKELKEKYGVEEVNVFVLPCFVSNIYEYNSSFTDDFFKQDFQDAYDELCSMGCKPNMPKQKYKMQFEKEKLNHKQECYINKIITTNSTGILEPQDSERLQVIDCKEIFEEYLKTER